MNLKDIANTLEALAEEALAAIATEAREVIEEVTPVIEDGFKKLLDDFGQLAVETVVALFGAAGAGLKGSEKANLAATTIVDEAAAKGVVILASDVTALVKNAYLAVVGKAQQ